jgi:hypothetical protein
MARKFLYAFAALVVIFFIGRVVLTFWSGDLAKVALVPDEKFERQAPIAANAYDNPAMWVSRPGLGASDPALWRPEGLKPDAAPGGAAVFFVHPTHYFNRAHWNAPLDDAEARKALDRMVRGMASPFNAGNEIWAPRYRAATFGVFLTDKPEAREALDLAYGDVRQAFITFLAKVPANKPIVLVGHSQGTLQLMRLIKEEVAGKPLAARIVAVYAIGWPVSLEHDLPVMGLPACAAPEQKGCVVSWLAYAEPAETGDTLAGYARFAGLDGKPHGNGAFLCSNPLTAEMGGSAQASANLGTLFPSKDMTGGTLEPGKVPARCGADNFLLIGAPPEMGEFVLPGNNYHLYDIPLFWANLRADVARRIAAWKAAQ